MPSNLPAGFELDSSFTAQPAPAAAPAQAAPAAPAQDQGPPPADSMVMDAGKALYTALHSAADTGTFGLADKAAAGISAAISPITGQPLSYDEAYARIKANNAKNAGEHPVAAAVGDVTGAVVGAGKLLKAAKMIPGAGAVIDALAPSATGSKLANVAKSAATGGIASGGYTAADDLIRNGEIDPSNVAINTAVGAAVGPAVSKIGTMVARGVQNASTKAMMLLASKLEESPATLQRAYDNFSAATGRVPTMAELVQMKSQGELKQLAQNNPIVQEGVNRAAETANAQRPQALSSIIEQNSGGHVVQDVSQLTQARAQRMTDSMNQIRGDRVLMDDQDAGILLDPRVRSAVRATKDPVLRDRLESALDEIHDNGQSDLLSVDDMDSIRKAVRNEQSNMANPNHPRANVQGARSMGNLADNIAELVTRGDPAHPYAQALEQFGNDSRYIKGFKHGMAGKTVGEADTPDLQEALNSAEGASGHEAGILARVANNAADPGATTRVAGQLAEGSGDSNVLRSAVGQRNFEATQRAAKAESEGAASLDKISGDIKPNSTDTVKQAGQAIGAAASHSPSGLLFHLSRIIPDFNKQTPAVQKQISRYLTDPKMTQQGINLLRRAGAKDADIRKLAVALSANAGLNVADTLGQ